MFGTPGKTAWRLLAVVPFVLLLGIVGIRATAGDPSSPFNKIPGAQTIQELGDDAPSTNVTVKLPKTKKPSPTTSASASASATASMSPSASASATTSATAKASAKPAPKPTRTPTSGSGGGGGSSAPTADPIATPPSTPLTAQQQCEAGGGHWREFLGSWSCWGI
jgi:cytoskeletal protein RodZ